MTSNRLQLKIEQSTHIERIEINVLDFDRIHEYCHFTILLQSLSDYYSGCEHCEPSF